MSFAEGARPTADGKPQPDIAIPSFGYTSTISICRRFGFIRTGMGSVIVVPFRFELRNPNLSENHGDHPRHWPAATAL